MKNLYKKQNRGMTYVELIVVLSIFAVMTAITMFNYPKFQAKVDIRNLTNDIALQIVKAQKASDNGVLPVSGGQIANWKPSYGLHFDLTGDNKSFLYFADLDQSKVYTPGTLVCSPGPSSECIQKILITKGNYISSIVVYPTVGAPVSYPILYMTFTRPDSGLTVAGTGPILTGVSYVQITVTSPTGISATIKAYASGRIQIN